MPLLVASVRDWDCQCQQRFDQTVAKQQLSSLDESNANEPGPLHKPTPKTPPSRITPNMRGARTMTGDVQGPGTGWIDNQSWTGCAARAGCAVGCIARVTDEVKATNTAKVGGALKAGGTVRAGATAAMKRTSLECGHPSEHAARARDTLKKIGPTDHQVPVPTVMSRTETLGMPHIRCPLKMKCPHS